MVLPPPARQIEDSNLPQRPVLIAVGRLSREKGFDILIEAFASIATQFPSWRLLILGEGPLRALLTETIRSYGVEERVSLPGQVKDPYPYLQNADVFVLSSRYEGFPNALCEAMSCGLPAVVTDCSPGVSEIARDQIDSLIIPPENVQALTAALRELMSNAGKRKLLGDRAREITIRFGLDGIMKTWEDMLNELQPPIH